MSELKVTTLQANLTTIGNTSNLPLGYVSQLSSGGLSFDGGNGVVNTTSIKVTSGGNSLTLQNKTTVSSINIAGNTVTSLFDETVNTQIFSANGFWQKPSWATTGNELVVVHLWGGGGGGNTAGFAGGGGAFVFGYMKGSQANQTVNATGTWCNVIVGLGGTGSADGGTSSFFLSSTNALNAYGGGGANATHNGCGGGWTSVGTRTNGGGPIIDAGGFGTNIIDSTFAGAAANSTVIGSSIYGGGGGASTTSPGGSSIYGGAGGRNLGSRSTSVYGGAGANSSFNSIIPAGGGGTSAGTIAGARGEVRVYTFRKIL